MILVLNGVCVWGDGGEREEERERERYSDTVEVNNYFLLPPAYCMILASFNNSLQHGVFVISCWIITNDAHFQVGVEPGPGLT